MAINGPSLRTCVIVQVLGAAARTPETRSKLNANVAVFFNMIADLFYYDSVDSTAAPRRIHRLVRGPAVYSAGMH